MSNKFFLYINSSRKLAGFLLESLSQPLGTSFNIPEK